MPYYVYRVTTIGDTVIKTLENLAEFEQFKQAKEKAREIRLSKGENALSQVKVIFAQNMLEAEERLLEKRDTPILREWEK